MPNLVKYRQRPINDRLPTFWTKLHSQEYLNHTATDGYENSHTLKQANGQHQRWEPAAADVRIAPDLNGWLPSAECCCSMSWLSWCYVSVGMDGGPIDGFSGLQPNLESGELPCPVP